MGTFRTVLSQRFYHHRPEPQTFIVPRCRSQSLDRLRSQKHRPSFPFVSGGLLIYSLCLHLLLAFPCSYFGRQTLSIAISCIPGSWSSIHIREGARAQPGVRSTKVLDRRDISTGALNSLAQWSCSIAGLLCFPSNWRLPLIHRHPRTGGAGRTPITWSWTPV
jgi:hypothetical protein